MYVILRGDLLKLSTGLCSWLVGRYGFPIPPSPPQSLSRSLALSLSLRELAHSLSLSLSLTHTIHQPGCRLYLRSLLSPGDALEPPWWRYRYLSKPVSQRYRGYPPSWNNRSQQFLSRPATLSVRRLPHLSLPSLFLPPPPLSLSCYLLLSCSLACVRALSRLLSCSLAFSLARSSSLISSQSISRGCR